MFANPYKQLCRTKWAFNSWSIWRTLLMIQPIAMTIVWMPINNISGQNWPFPKLYVMEIIKTSLPIICKQIWRKYLKQNIWKKHLKTFEKKTIWKERFEKKTLKKTFVWNIWKNMLKYLENLSAFLIRIPVAKDF